MSVSRRKRRAYNARDLAEACAWSRDFFVEDGDGYSHQLGAIDIDEITQVATLIARVRRRGERVAKQLRNELVRNNERTSGGY